MMRRSVEINQRTLDTLAQTTRTSLAVHANFLLTNEAVHAQFWQNDLDGVFPL